MRPQQVIYILPAIRQLGLQRVALNAVYQVLLKTGVYRLITPPKTYDSVNITLREDIPFPEIPLEFLRSRLSLTEKTNVLIEADEIVSGKLRFFDGPPRPLYLDPATGRKHWSHFDKSFFNGEDIKFTWEPARFEWLIPLGRAYLLSAKEIYPEAFWRYFETFIQNNPPNCGPNWASAQEVAIRILMMAYALRVFNQSAYTTTSRKHLLARVMARHAERISPTLLYARSQNNNHLLLEAVGLYTAGVLLPAHTSAADWRKTGWYWFNQGIKEQIEPNGTYIQHSVNYHRLMLQAALWMQQLARHQGDNFPLETNRKLAAATRWLLDLIDPVSAQVPNLGNNDGAYLFPLAPGGFKDYRPVLQASSTAFLHSPALYQGEWDELSLWMGLSPASEGQEEFPTPMPTGSLKVGTNTCWANLRAVRFHFRPAHADQLHVDLWAYGQNICRDAGTYLYNGEPPWNNTLAGTAVHNTLTLAGKDQMQRAGRFLWLNPAQAKVLLSKNDEVMAEHDGYRQLGWIHRRSLKYASPDAFIITDRLVATRPHSQDNEAVLHWLLPDWPWELTGTNLTLKAPFGEVNFSLQPQAFNTAPSIHSVEIIRAGENINGAFPVPAYLGWYSPTYGVKEAALAYRILFSVRQEISITMRISIHKTLTIS